MAKRIDLTDKLKFEEKPVIVIKGKEIEINDDASNMLKIMALLDEEGKATPTAMLEITDLLFTKQGRKNLDALKLNSDDFSVVIETAMDMVSGDEEEGELENDSTTLSETGN